MDAFEIKASPTSSGAFQTVLNGNLQDARYKQCANIPVETFTLSSSVYARYVKLYITSSFGISGGLQYLGFLGQEMGVEGNNLFTIL